MTKVENPMGFLKTRLGKGFPQRFQMGGKPAGLLMKNKYKNDQEISLFDYNNFRKWLVS